jgi:copper chaperone CopZ
MRLQVTIEGMLAVHARHAVFTALGAVDGLTRADVELGRAELELDGQVSEAAARAAIREAIEAAGFGVSEIRALPRTLPTFGA